MPAFGGALRQVTAAVIIEDGLLFLARRGPGEKLPGFWELPGGKIEPGETPQECLQRELAEELDMLATAGEVLAQTVYRYDHGEFEMLALAVERKSAYALSVHDACEWLSREQLSEVQLAPADVELLQALRAQGVW